TRVVPSGWCSFCTAPRHHAGSPVDRLSNLRIGAAATDVACHRLVDVFVARSWLFAEQDGRADQLSGLTVAALRYVFGYPGALQGVTQVWRQPLDVRYLLSHRPRYWG